MPKQQSDVIDNKALFLSIKHLIEQSRQQVAVTVNAAITKLYWQVGRHISEEILKSKRAEYGKQVIVLLAQQLRAVYGRGWSQRQLFYCIRFSEIFPNEEILHTLCAILSWSHIRLILALEDPLTRSDGIIPALS